MYRIELKPGEETVFRTIEELATGIRNGLVTPRARIFHNASQKWLPIEFHPHYKKALTMPATKSGETPAVAMPPRAPSAPPGGLTFIEVEPLRRLAPVAASAPPRAVTSPVVDLPTIEYTDSPARDSEHPVAHAPLARRPLGRPRALRLGLAAALLIGGAYMVLSASKPAPTAAAAPSLPPAAPSARQEIEDPVPVEQVAAVQSTSGPALSGPPTPTPPASKRAITTSIGAAPATLNAKVDSATIEPPPADVDLSVPSIPKGESLAPILTNDSNAIRRILRAVGGKTEPAQP